MRTLKYIIIGIAAIAAAACSSNFDTDYNYDSPDQGYTGYAHNEPPRATQPGKLIFDYSFKAIGTITPLLEQIWYFNDILAADQLPEYGIASNGNNIYKENYNDGTLLIDTGGKLLSDDGARWNICCSSESIFIPDGSCTLTNTGGTVAFELTDSRFDNYNCRASIGLGAKKNTLDSVLPYLFSIRGTIDFSQVDYSDYVLHSQFDQPIEQVDVRLSYSGSYVFFNGNFTITATQSGKEVDSAGVKMTEHNRVTITYGEAREVWLYDPTVRYYYL